EATRPQSRQPISGKAQRTFDFMNPAPHILAETSPSVWGLPNGGYRRTLQLHQLLMDADMQVEVVAPPAKLTQLHYYCKGIRFLCQTGFGAGCNPGLVREHGMVLARLEPGLRNHCGDKVLLWEVTRRNHQAVPFLARRFGYSVVALPHNLQTLVPALAPARREMITRYFEEELRALRAVDAIFTISREEQWLLLLHELAPLYLPYFPVEKLAGDLLKLRSRRQGAGANRLLILGTAWNVPTHLGMMELIEMLRDLPGGAAMPVDIAGFGTEQLQGRLDGTAWRLHGGVDDAKLAELMQNARAVLVHQRSGAGVLTRIPEMLLAGLPVIANGIAARSHARLDGLYVYETREELSELLQHPLAEPAAPRRPAGAEQRLVQVVRHQVAAHRSPQAMYRLATIQP
ncbi:MAG TPA: hypothetical protein VFC07_14745, partial [Verrucomicrobiae bacterium]|nr:hypothetical protein [Verrucomicrobiae bacterium]